MADDRRALTVRARARDRIASLLWFGGFLYVVGSLIGLASVRSWRDDGTVIGVFVGGLVTAAGVALVLVALIGWGTRLGREAADRGDDVVEERVRPDLSPDVRVEGL